MSTADPHPIIHVVAAAVIDAHGRVLIAQRPPGTHLAGGWEFPGGKLEPGEERRAGLARELHEELGITIGAPRPLVRIRHAYPSREVLLDLWVVRRYGGEPRGLDGQALRWCAPEELAAADLLPADKPILAVLRLPERLIEASTPEYRVGDIDYRVDLGYRMDPGHGVDADVPALAPGGRAARDDRLRGIHCSSAGEAVRAAGGGADFLAMRGEVSREALAALCESVPIPVYARGLDLYEAWSLGATGTNEIPV